MTLKRQGLLSSLDAEVIRLGQRGALVGGTKMGSFFELGTEFFKEALRAKVPSREGARAHPAHSRNHSHRQDTLSPSAEQLEIADLMDRRSQLSEQLARERNRLKKASPTIVLLIEEMVGFVKKQISAVDEAIEQALAKSERLAALSGSLREVSGVGKVAAWTLLAYLTEIGQVKRGEVAALDGVAPYNRDSGEKRGQASHPGRSSQDQALPFHGGPDRRDTQSSDESLRQQARRKGRQALPASDRSGDAEAHHPSKQHRQKTGISRSTETQLL